MKKKWLLYFTSLFTFLGCIRTVSEESGRQEIRFYGNIQKLQKVDLAARGGFISEDKVQLYIVEQDGEGVKLPSGEDFYQMSSDDDGNLSFEVGETHVYPDNPINVYGFCCKGKEGMVADITAMTIAVAEAQLTEDALLTSDLLYVKSEERYRASDNAIVLNFKHQFSKLQFNFRTDTPETVNLNVTGIEVLNVVREGEFNISSGDLTLGEDPGDIQVRAGDGATALVLPQQINGGELLFRFMVDAKEWLYSVPDAGFLLEKGKLYRYDILINNYPGVGDKDIIVNTTIEDWDESEPPITIVFEDGQNVMVKLADVSTGVSVSRADLYVSSEDATREILNIPVTNNELEFIFPRKKQGATLQLNRAHFYTESGEEFDYYFKDKQLLGDNLDRLSLVAPEVGDTWMGGTIFVVGKVTGYNKNTLEFITDARGVNAYKGRVVSNRSLGEMEWCKYETKGAKTFINMNDENDGQVNLKTLLAFIESKGESLEDYLAFNVLEKGWYLPAINEISSIVANKEKLNENIREQQGDVIGDGVYVSSTERGKDSPTDIRYAGGQGYNSKAVKYNIREVRVY